MLRPKFLLRTISRFYRCSNMSSSSDSSSSPPNSYSNARIPIGSDAHALASLMDAGVSPRELLGHFMPSFRAPPGTDDMMLWRLVVSMIEPPKRKKLPQFNTIDDAIALINKSKKILVLSGAGISTSAGLPDFRSRDGIYVQINAEHPDLRDPKLMFDIEYFRKNPRPFYQFAKALYPGQFRPTIGHKFIKCIEDQNKLLRNYSQNIDTLEKQAGIKRVVECHGSFARATCTNCRYSVDGDVIRDDVFRKEVPLCPKCHAGGNQPDDGLGVMKPNIVFFGEQLGNEFHSSIDTDKEQADLLIVIGSSLKVKPVALIPRSVSAQVPQILINKEPLDHMGFDIELLGNCDDIIQELCLRLGNDWTQVCATDTSRLKEVVGMPPFGQELVVCLENYAFNDTQDAKTSPNKEISVSDEKPTRTEVKAECESTSFNNLPEESISEGPSSFRSNQANVASESTTIEQRMIEELDAEETEDQNDDKTKQHDGGAIRNCDQNSEGDWEDVEVLDSLSDSEDDAYDKANLNIPDSSYVFLAPNRYLFRGVELTNAQYESFIKRSKTST